VLAVRVPRNNLVFPLYWDFQLLNMLLELSCSFA